MKVKVLCPVCLVPFLTREPLQPGATLTCPVCGAKLEVADASRDIQMRRFPQEPQAEIRERIETYARLKGYVFSEDKELVIEGLIGKNEKYGDFFCPCRIENLQAHICPCLETRKGRVQKEGMCLCGLFHRKG